MHSTRSSAGRKFNWLVICLPLVLILFLLSGPADKARAAVTLISFTATGLDGFILVEWETATEIDNAGFFIQASDQEAGTYTRIGEFIFSDAFGLTGAYYVYEDEDVIPGVRKWYKLESVANDQTSELSSPTSAVASQSSTTIPGTPTPTPTATASPTATDSSTSVSSPTWTSTATIGGAYPGPATATPPYPGIPTTVSPYLGVPTTVVPFQGFTSTPGGPLNPVSTPDIGQGLAGTVLPQESQLAIPDASLAGTLVPLPEITIQFLNGTPGTQELNVLADPSLADDSQAGGSPGWSRYGTLSFIMLIWALLGGWFWLTFRKID